MAAAEDPFGNPLTLQHAASAQAVCGFVEGLLGYTPRVLEVLAVAEHDASAIVQACSAALWMFSESPAGPPKARAHLDRARQAALPASHGERLFLAAISAWVDGDMAQALALHTQLAREHPRDLAALKIGQVHAFNLGDAPTMLKLALAAAPAARDVAWMHGMLAFGHEQCHRLPEAEAAARRALAMRPAEPWAQHALAHVMLTDGRLREGLAFMHAASAEWRSLTSFMRCHNAWHLALFQLELGDTGAALALYDTQVWGVDKHYSQDQVGAVSLLARLELAGVGEQVDLAGRWAELATYLAVRTGDLVQPFLDLQYLYGLARAGRPEADTLLAAINDFAPRAPVPTREAWQQVALPAAHGLVLHARGLAAQGTGAGAQQACTLFARSARLLEQALPRLAAIGGSHAQRDLFAQLHLDALQRCGQWAGVLDAVQPRANAAPQSWRLQRLAARAGHALGLPPR